MKTFMLSIYRQKLYDFMGYSELAFQEFQEPLMHYKFA
jgi:hypothetical protein